MERGTFICVYNIEEENNKNTSERNLEYKASKDLYNSWTIFNIHGFSLKDYGKSVSLWLEEH